MSEKRNNKETKIASKFLLLLIALFSIISLILLVSALTPQEEIVNYNLINGGII